MRALRVLREELNPADPSRLVDESLAETSLVRPDRSVTGAIPCVDAVDGVPEDFVSKC